MTKRKPAKIMGKADETFIFDVPFASAVALASDSAAANAGSVTRDGHGKIQPWKTVGAMEKSWENLGFSW